MKKIAVAFQFLSIVPLKFNGELTGCSAFFPLVGWFFGGVLWLVFSMTVKLPQTVQAFWLLLVWEALSRGLHLDGLADTADAFIAVKDKATTLRILKDSHIGAFGAMAIFMLLIGKFALLSTVKPEALGVSLVASTVIARFFIVILSAIFPSTKKEGLGFLIMSSTGAKEATMAAILTLPLVLVIPLTINWYVFLVLLGPVLLAWHVNRRIGGLTGDVLGAILEITELLTLMIFLFV